MSPELGYTARANYPELSRILRLANIFSPRQLKSGLHGQNALDELC